MASDSVTETYRPIYLEDLSHAASAGQVTDTVLNLGPVPMTPIVAAASDSAAASAGIPLWGIYLNTSVVPNFLKARSS